MQFADTRGFMLELEVGWRMAFPSHLLPEGRYDR
jgi:hypothetical protein